jgi:hypothetical protein
MYPTGSTPTSPPYGFSTGEADGGGSTVIELAVSGKPKDARQIVLALKSEYETICFWPQERTKHMTRDFRGNNKT